MPKISVIIPLYNKEKYIAQTIESLLIQSFSDFEIVIVDDGSTDGSSSIIDSYAEKDNRITVFHICNGGVSRARNIGLDNSLGEYVTFVDSDDSVHEDYLSNLYSCINESGADLVIG